MCALSQRNKKEAVNLIVQHHYKSPASDKDSDNLTSVKDKSPKKCAAKPQDAEDKVEHERQITNDYEVEKIIGQGLKIYQQQPSLQDDRFLDAKPINLTSRLFSSRSVKRPQAVKPKKKFFPQKGCNHECSCYAYFKPKSPMPVTANRRKSSFSDERSPSLQHEPFHQSASAFDQPLVPTFDHPSNVLCKTGESTTEPLSTLSGNHHDAFPRYLQGSFQQNQASSFSLTQAIPPALRIVGNTGFCIQQPANLPIYAQANQAPSVLMNPLIHQVSLPVVPNYVQSVAFIQQQNGQMSILRLV